MLKLLAALFMLIDHAGYLFSPWMSESIYLVLRSVGRLAFPIFAFYVAVGFRRTKSRLRYFLRMTVFAILSQLIFNYAYQLASVPTDFINILFTFVGALGFLSGWLLFTNSTRDVVGRMELLPDGQRPDNNDPMFQLRMSLFGISLPTWLGRALGGVAMALSLIFVEWIGSDYGAYGVLTVFSFYLVSDERLETNQAKLERALVILVVLNILAYVILNYIWVKGFSELQLLSILALPLIFSDKIKERKPSLLFRYFFYFFYPLHFLLLALAVHLLRR